MDPASLLGSATNAPRKVRFAPKAPPRKVQKPVVPKPEKVEEDVDAAKAQELLRRLNETSIKTKAERKAIPTRVAFGFGGSSAPIKSYGAPKGVNKYQSSASDGGDVQQGLEKEYKEPWDYYSYYPVTLPLRRPYSGNPELLDEEEFGEASENVNYDEDSCNPAVELGLMEENLEERLLFLQLPAIMPMPKQSKNAEANEMANNPKPLRGKGQTKKTCALNELPAGFMGKMLVYKSGAVKLKLGDTLYDVSPGIDVVFAQDAVAINTEEKSCCNVGELNMSAIITPDVDSMLDSMSDLL